MPRLVGMMEAENDKMALYSRSVPHESRAADDVQRTVQRYPDGVTFEELMRDNPQKDRSSILAAIELLIEEGKIKSNRPWSGKGFLDEVKLCVPTPPVDIIRSIHIENLLSFGADNPLLDLRSLNVLIGPNGSGKSNLIEVLGLLQSTGQDLSQPIREGGGITEWLWKGASKRKPPAASIEVLVARDVEEKLLRYKLSFTQLGSTMEILDERIEDEFPDGNNKTPNFYY